MAGKKSSFNLMNLVSVVAIAVVLGLGIWAVSGTVSENLETNRLADQSNWKIADYADQSGMSVEEFIAQYDLTAEDGITAKSTPLEMLDKLSLEHYASFGMGRELTDEEFAEFKKANEIAEDVTKDTKDKDIKDKYATFASQKMAEEQAAAAAQEQAAAEAEAAQAEVTEEVPAEASAEEAPVEETEPAAE